MNPSDFFFALSGLIGAGTGWVIFMALVGKAAPIEFICECLEDDAWADDSAFMKRQAD